jgi:polyisoprenyl-teichoic acid--peptidoglycan teichoic acid transferase
MRMTAKQIWISLLLGLALAGLTGCYADNDGELSPVFVGMAPSIQALAAIPLPTAPPSPTVTPLPSAPSVPTATPAPPTATPSPTPEPPPLSLRETDNLLLLGTDRRPGWTNWRTDSMMIVGIDHEYGRAAILSIPRDLYVNVPGYGQARINQVDYIGEKTLKVEGGGPALLSQVISQTLGISTNHWVRIELKGFEQMVDALGGVDMQLDCPFYELIYDLDVQAWTFFELPAGTVHMDGITAYRFVTLRYIESDFGRSRRQRQFLWALRNQAIDTDLILRVPELWRAFNETFSTDLSLIGMVQLARFGLSIQPENVRAAALTDKELERYITAGGADVLRIANPARVQEVIDNIWSGSTLLAETGRRDPESCPPKPGRVPTYVTQQVVLPVPGVPVVQEEDPDSIGGGGGELIAVEAEVDEGAPPAQAEEALPADERDGSPPQEAAPAEDPAPGEETAGEEQGNSGG